MADIVARLRLSHCKVQPGKCICKAHQDMRDAADEIERLRAALSQAERERTAAALHRDDLLDENRRLRRELAELRGENEPRGKEWLTPENRDHLREVFDDHDDGNAVRPLLDALEQAERERDEHEVARGAIHEDWVREVSRRAQAERERDEARELQQLDERCMRFVSRMMDGVGDVDFDEEAAVNASACGREEPNDDDYLAAARTAILVAIAIDTAIAASQGSDAAMANDSECGLYRKYRVERLHDPTGKHARCDYYVLDLTHDPHAIPALRAYADSCAADYPHLAADLRAWADDAASQEPHK